MLLCIYVYTLMVTHLCMHIWQLKDNVCNEIFQSGCLFHGSELKIILFSCLCFLMRFVRFWRELKIQRKWRVRQGSGEPLILSTDWGQGQCIGCDLVNFAFIWKSWMKSLWFLALHLDPCFCTFDNNMIANISWCRFSASGYNKLHLLILVDKAVLAGVGIGHTIFVSGELASLELFVWVPVWLVLLHLCCFWQKRAIIGAGDACRLWSWDLPSGGYIPNGNAKNSTPGCWSAR